MEEAPTRPMELVMAPDMLQATGHVTQLDMGPPTVLLMPRNIRLHTLLTPVMCATVLRATTAALTASLLLPVAAAAAPVASSALVMAPLLVPPALVASIKTQVRRQVARHVQG